MNGRTSITAVILCAASVLNSTNVEAQHCANGQCRISAYPASAQSWPQTDGYQSNSRLQYNSTYQQQPHGGSQSCADGHCQSNSRHHEFGCDANGGHCQGAAGSPARRQHQPSPESYQQTTPPLPLDTSGPMANDWDPSLRTPRYAPVSYRTNNIAWETDIRAAVQRSRSTGQPMLVQVTAKWCGHCQQMKRETYTSRGLIFGINRDFIAVSLDADDSRDIVQMMKIRSLPTTLVVLPNLDVVERLEGYQSASQLQTALGRYAKRAQLQIRPHVVNR